MVVNEAPPFAAPRPTHRDGAGDLEPVLRLAERCRYEVRHSRHVTDLALMLFDELRPWHGLGPTDRFDLQAGGLLHDIGWIGGKRSHHKRSQRLILEADELPFETHRRRVVGCIARYHRKSLPKASHEVFAALAPAERHRVRLLGGMVRLADDLDNGHRQVVRALTCAVQPASVHVRCQVRDAPEADRLIGEPKKTDLLEAALDRPIHVTWR